MEFSIFHEFLTTQTGSQAEAFAQSFAQIEVSESWGLDVVWLAEIYMNPTRSLLSAPLTVAGAIANRGATVASLTNVFSAAGDLDAAWSGSLAAVAALVEDVPLVGYERGDDLEAARRYGFALLGPLLVWINGRR